MGKLMVSWSLVYSQHCPVRRLKVNEQRYKKVQKSRNYCAAVADCGSRHPTQLSLRQGARDLGPAVSGCN